MSRRRRTQNNGIHSTWEDRGGIWPQHSALYVWTRCWSGVFVSSYWHCSCRAPFNLKVFSWCSVCARTSLTFLYFERRWSLVDSQWRKVELRMIKGFQFFYQYLVAKYACALQKESIKINFPSTASLPSQRIPFLGISSTSGGVEHVISEVSLLMPSS